MQLTGRTVSWAASCAVALAHAVGASEPLHVRIDQLISATEDFKPAPPANDATFLRRAYLDFAGIIPPPDAVHTFLADHSDDKRARLVDELLTIPEYAWHMSRVFDVMLDQRMREREDDVIQADPWRKYLRESFRENKSWSQLVTEILGTDGTDAKLRPALRFYFSRKGDLGQLIPDVSAILLGRNLRCAQCHDHPVIDEYRQADFFGLAAFYSRVGRGTVGGKPVLVEKPVGTTAFTSTLTSERGTSLPRIFDGPELAEPSAVKSLQATYERMIKHANQAADAAKAANDALAAAKQKTQAAEQSVKVAAEAKTTAEATLACARKAVDAAKDGADAAAAVKKAGEAEKAAIDALTETLSKLTAAQQAATAALNAQREAEAVAVRAEAGRRDAKRRQTAAQTALYIIPPADKVRPIPIFSRRAYLAPMVLDHPAFRRNIVNRLWAMLMGRGLIEPLDLDYADNPASHPELLKLLADEFAAMDYDIKAFLRKLALTDTYARSSRVPETADDKPVPYATATLRPLSPEQLAWSWLRATGRLDVELRAIEEETKPKQAETLSSREWQLEQLHLRLRDEAKEVVTRFVTSIPGEASRSDAGPEQALFLLNAEVVGKWLKPQSGNLVDRLVKIDDPSTLARDLFVSLLCRVPTEAEVALVRETLATSEQQPADALADLAWSLLSSSEFRFNY